MIVGLGIDSVMVERIAQKIENPDFIKKVFSEKEISYCQKNTHPAEHFAARFAAKEAFLKAIGAGLGITYELSQIEILNEDSGAPALVLHGAFEDIKERWNHAHISLTHTNSVASAIIILEK